MVVVKDYRFKVDPVQWHEGMPLAPQHFQLNDHRYQSILSFLLKVQSPFSWGVSELEVDMVALSKGMFQIKNIAGLMPDGMFLQYADSPHLPKLEIPLAELNFNTRSVHDIYLAVPSLSPNNPSASGETPRYISTPGDLVLDENGSFGEPTRVPRLAPNLYLIVGSVPSDKFVGFKIAEVSKVDGQFSLGNYLPPCLYLLEGSSVKKRLTDLMFTIRSKVTYTLDRFDAASDNPAQTRTREIMFTLIEATLPFEVLLKQRNVHPFAMYQELVRLAATVTRLSSHLEQVPLFDDYDHESLYETFSNVIDFSKQIIDKMYDRVQIRTFQQKRGYFGLSLPSVWGTKKILLGIKRNIEVSKAEICAWVDNAVIGSEKILQSIVDRRIVGPKRRVLGPEEKTVVVAPNDVVLVEVEIDPRFIELGEVLYIFNPSDSKRVRPLEVYHYITAEDL